MKAILLALTLFASLSASAQRGIQPVTAKFANLSRIFKITLEGKQYEVGVKQVTNYSLYYGTLPMTADEIYAYIWNSEYNTNQLELQVIVEKNLYRFKLAQGQRPGLLKGTKRPLVKGSAILSELTSTTLWYNFDHNSTEGQTEAEATLDTPLYSRNNLSQVITTTGALRFSPCDGCEHSDQMWINNVNIVNMDFGAWYTADCEGQVERLFDRLLEDHLQVPFTYKGRVHHDSSDYIEEFNDQLVADKDGGQFFVGTTTKLPFRIFMDSLIHRSAFLLGVEVASIERDVFNHGKFESYKDGILTFTFRTVTIRTNLLTGQTL